MSTDIDLNAQRKSAQKHLAHTSDVVQDKSTNDPSKLPSSVVTKTIDDEKAPASHSHNEYRRKDEPIDHATNADKLGDVPAAAFLAKLSHATTLSDTVKVFAKLVLGTVDFNGNAFDVVFRIANNKGLLLATVAKTGDKFSVNALNLTGVDVSLLAQFDPVNETLYLGARLVGEASAENTEITVFPTQPLTATFYSTHVTDGDALPNQVTVTLKTGVLTTSRGLSVIGEVRENGKRLYSENNPNITQSYQGDSATLYASQKALNDLYKALNTSIGGEVSPTPETLVKRSVDGDVATRTISATLDDSMMIEGALAFRANNTDDNILRYCSDITEIRKFLAVPSMEVKNVLENNPASKTVVRVGQETRLYVNQQGTYEVGSDFLAGDEIEISAGLGGDMARFNFTGATLTAAVSGTELTDDHLIMRAGHTVKVYKVDAVNWRVSTGYGV